MFREGNRRRWSRETNVGQVDDRKEVRGMRLYQTGHNLSQEVLLTTSGVGTIDTTLECTLNPESSTLA